MSPEVEQTAPARVEITEVGPRDGLQQEQTLLAADEKVAIIDNLAAAGIKRIQVTAFVHPKLMPQMADAEEVCARLPRRSDVIYSGLALNLKGVERAQNAGLSHVDISVSAHETHSRLNLNRSLTDALNGFEAMVSQARERNTVVRGGIQCAFGYLQPDDVPPEKVVEIGRRLLASGIDELALADTAGLASPRQITEMLELLAGTFTPMPVPITLHLHDTRGMGLANVAAALRCGVRHFDTAFGGLGGCPFIEGAAGNIATEDTVHMLGQMDFETGVDVRQVARLSRRLEKRLGKASLPGKLYALLDPAVEAA